MAAGLLIFRAYRGLQTTPMSAFLKSDFPILNLDLQFLDIRQKKIAPEKTKFAGDLRKEKPAKEAPSFQGCPELVGGDTTNRYSLPAGKNFRADCPKVAKWMVKHHPIGLSLYFREARQVLSFLRENSQDDGLLKTKFFQGLFHDPLHTASVRAEDLQLEGIQGVVLEKLIREALEADGTLHYDIAHGSKGFVFSFIRNECPFAGKALPVMVRSLARSGYRIPKLEEPILEMRIGLQRLFLTQFEDRVYLANGLETLINVLENLPPAGKSLPKTPLVLSLRTEAFVNKLLPLMIGEPTWHLELGFSLVRSEPQVLQFGAGKFTKQLRPKVFKGVLASIPHDVFAAVVTSYYLPPGITTEQWQELATHGPADRPAPGPEEAGVAFLWELDPYKNPQLTNMGVVIANQTTPDEVKKFKTYFADANLTAECGGGTVFLAATSRTLLFRMYESCAGQSLSVLDWERGSKTKEYENSQLFLFMNPGAGMREILVAGGAGKGNSGDFEPKWKQEYEKAKEAMRAEGEKIFNRLPIFAYSGRSEPGAKLVHLKGLLIQQGKQNE